MTAKQQLEQKILEKTSELIGLLQEIGNDETNETKLGLIEKAQCTYEAAAMWATKVIKFEKEK